MSIDPPSPGIQGLGAVAIIDSPGQTYFADTDLPPGTTFYYEVIAIVGMYPNPIQSQSAPAFAEATTLPPDPQTAGPRFGDWAVAIGNNTNDNVMIAGNGSWPLASMTVHRQRRHSTRLCLIRVRRSLTSR